MYVSTTLHGAMADPELTFGMQHQGLSSSLVPACLCCLLLDVCARACLYHYHTSYTPPFSFSSSCPGLLSTRRKANTTVPAWNTLFTASSCRACPVRVSVRHKAEETYLPMPWVPTGTSASIGVVPRWVLTRTRHRHQGHDRGEGKKCRGKKIRTSCPSRHWPASFFAAAKRRSACDVVWTWRFFASAKKEWGTC